MNVLVIAAHPDDEVLGMGGTIKKYTKNKHNVKIVIMATGIFARRSQNGKNSTTYNVDEQSIAIMEKKLDELRCNAKKATKILGVTDLELLDFPDNEMDKVSNLEITKKIESIIEKFKPTVVFTHTQHDINIDHRIIYNATVTATRPTQIGRAHV